MPIKTDQTYPAVPVPAPVPLPESMTVREIEPDDLAVGVVLVDSDWRRSRITAVREHVFPVESDPPATPRERAMYAVVELTPVDVLAGWVASAAEPIRWAGSRLVASPEDVADGEPLAAAPYQVLEWDGDPDTATWYEQVVQVQLGADERLRRVWLGVAPPTRTDSEEGSTDD